MTALSRADELLERLRGFGGVHFKDLSRGEASASYAYGDENDFALDYPGERKKFLRSRNVVMIGGWVPEDKFKRLAEIVAAVCGERYSLAFEDAPPGGADVPVKLSNRRMIEPFERVTEAVAFPRYGEPDPTPLIAPFYWLFFGLLTGDAGFGVVILIVTAALLKFNKLKREAARLARLFHYLGYAAVLAGTLYGRLFGRIFFAPMIGRDGPKPVLDAGLDLIKMLALSAAFGYIHMLVRLAATGFNLLREKKYFDAATGPLCQIAALVSAAGILAGFFSGGADRYPLALFSACVWIFAVSFSLFAYARCVSGATFMKKIAGFVGAFYWLFCRVRDLSLYLCFAAFAFFGAFITDALGRAAAAMPGVLRWALGEPLVVAFGIFNMAFIIVVAYARAFLLQSGGFLNGSGGRGGVKFEPFA